MEMFSFMMNSDDFVTLMIHAAFMKADEAMVTHGVMSFPDGTREAVLSLSSNQGWASY